MRFLQFSQYVVVPVAALLLSHVTQGLNIAHSAQLVVMNVVHLLLPMLPIGDPLQQSEALATTLEQTVNFIAGVVFFISIAIGAMMRMTAWGNEQKIAISNRAFAAAIVGLAVFAADHAISSYISTLFQ